MDPEKLAELKKALIEKGLTDKDAEDVLKGFPFEKKDDGKDGKDDKDDKDDKSKVEKSADGDADDKAKVEKSADGDKDDKPADFEKLAKSLEDLKAQLSLPSGLSDKEVSDKIAKAVAEELEPAKRHALMVAESSDLLVKAQQTGMDSIRKGLESLAGVVTGLLHAVQNPPELLAKSVAQEASVKDLESRLADLTKENDDLRKSLVTKPKAVTADNISILSHPSDVPAEDKNLWTQSLMLKAVEQIKTASTDPIQRAKNVDRANNILNAAMGGSSPAAIAQRFNLEVPK